MTEEEQGPQIIPTENGPYAVTGSVPVNRAEGEPAREPRDRVLLCRCGGSSNKPFCDATHRTNGFVGTESGPRNAKADRQDTYQGDGITILDDRSICAHIGNCTDNLTKVFKLGTEPWIEPKGEAAEAIAQVIATCPSGALGYALATSPQPVEAEHEPGITASKNGPYFVVGRIPVKSPDGSTYEVRARMALCRCGGSGNKPFCDGTHWSNGFED